MHTHIPEGRKLGSHVGCEKKGLEQNLRCLATTLDSYCHTIPSLFHDALVKGMHVLTIRKYCPLWEGELMAVLCFTGIHGFGLAERLRQFVQFVNKHNTQLEYICT